MLTRIFLLALTLSLSSCFLKPYKMDIQQGNYIDAEALSRLKPGMTRSQVRFLLGTPLITDPFHPERWDYLFIDRRAGKLRNERRATLWFEGDSLTRAVTDTEPASPGAQGSDAPAPDAPAPNTPASNSPASNAPAANPPASSAPPAQPAADKAAAKK